MAKSTPQKVFRKLGLLYKRMVDEYEVVSGKLGLTCADCDQNCCVSYFQHHTYVEWAYLWKGLKALPESQRDDFLRRAGEYVDQAGAMLAQGVRPNVMCPLNVDGLCGLYGHRLMICRLHGVPNVMVRPDGRSVSFPGCHRSQELSEGFDQPPTLDRTPLYRELVKLEMEFLGNKIRRLPKVDMTLAEMIVNGPPVLR